MLPAASVDCQSNQVPTRDQKNEDSASAENDSPLWVFDSYGVLVKLTLELPTKQMVEEDKAKPAIATFHLFSLNNVNKSDRLVPNDRELLARSHFDPAKPTTIVTHGWKSSMDQPSCQTIKDGNFLPLFYFGEQFFCGWEKKSCFALFSHVGINSKKELSRN